MNPGNPYGPTGVSRTEHGFRTFGSKFGPVDAVATIPEMATRALKAAWFHKWIVNLRMRPEEYGALVQANLTHTHPVPQAAGALHSDVFNSAALSIIHSKYGSYLLPQAFPEGFADPSLLSDGAWHGRRSLHLRVEVLLRRQARRSGRCCKPRAPT